MTWLMSDLRIAVRTLWRRKGLATGVVSALGLGIGLAAAVVILAWSVLGRPLPYPGADRLVTVLEVTESGTRLPASYMNFSDWRYQVGGFTALTAVAGPVYRTVAGGERLERVPAAFVSTDYFATAGVAPVLGRPLTSVDQEPDSPEAVVVSYAFWERVLGSPQDLSGVRIETQDLMNRVAVYAVVGVMPPGFALQGAADLYLPLDRAVRGTFVATMWCMFSGGWLEA